ncbi:MAG TPA: hypothetical protein VHI76_02540 [Solirubrobacterales bacterium]|jgi:hypothetical protein|nr:hypothetical protein [Solirubrobacterales bacterium]
MAERPEHDDLAEEKLVESASHDPASDPTELGGGPEEDEEGPA